MVSLVAESLFWVAVASCAVAQVAIVRGVLGGRLPDRPPAPGESAADPPARSGQPHPVREAAWALLPGLVLVLVLVWTWRTMHLVPQGTRPTDTGSLAAPSPSTGT
jgi:hypothetical protein